MTNEKIIPVTCTSSHLVDIEKLKPIQGKLKSRTRKQLYSLRSLIIKYGFSFPMYIWQDGNIQYTLDGHGRDYICKELVKEGYAFQQKDGSVSAQLPAVLIDAKNKIEAKEKLLALNSSFGTITEEGLIEFIFEPYYELHEFLSLKENLDIPDINLDLLVPDMESTGEDTSAAAKEYLYIFSHDKIKQSIKDNFPTFKSTKEIIDGIIDFPLAMHHFNKLCSGNKNVGYEISLLFNPHRLETKINTRKFSTSEAFIQKERGMVTSIAQWMAKNQKVVHNSGYIREARVGTGTQLAHEFKPYLAREIYLDYCSNHTKVLDPCAGWGGRMLGFTSALLGGEYHATDPSSKTYEGLLKLREFILSAEFTNIPEISIFNLPFEEMKLRLDYYDFAFTSPPYFNTEIYSEEHTQAGKRYSTIEEFNDKFLRVLIKNTMDALKPGKPFLLNIGGNQYPFHIYVNQICNELKLSVKEIFKYKIGRGEPITKNYKGDVEENSLKANDLFFEIRK